MPANIILFDFDGTLADSAQCAILATRQAFRDHHLPAPADAAIVQQMGIPIERCFRTLGATALDDDAFAALLATFRQHYAAAAESHIRLYPGIAALLAALKAQQRQTGIVSSKKTAILRANCEQLGISAHIDVFIGSDTVQHYKPHPEGIRLVLAALAIAFLAANRITAFAEQHYYGDPVVYERHTPYQRLVITRWKDDTRLYLNGNLQFSSRDEARYHEALVLPAMQMAQNPARVLILGGGDGLAAREVLKYPQVQDITLVDLDVEMTRTFASSATLTALNNGALNHPKLRVINADAAQWLEENRGEYDVIIIDLPDPSNFSLGKLYSVPMYRLVARHLAPDGYLVVQSTSPYFAPNAYWSVVATLEAANLYTAPYHVYVPSFGEWGYVLAARADNFPVPRHFDAPTRYLNGETAAEMFRFPPDMARREVEPNYLNTQKLVSYFEQDWGEVQR